jgi:DNA-binding transcriptional LysR family regulator
MELRQLRHFVAVADDGNISRAAKKVFLSQPALSRQIKALEDEIGQCLLERQAHSIRLTPVGEALLRDARHLLQQADQVLERARNAGRGPRLRIGYAPSLAAGILSPAVENFTQAHPNARVELLDSSTNQMLIALESGALDVALSVGEQRPTRGLTWELLVRAPWCLAVSRNHPFARRSQVTLAEVSR